MTDDEWDVEIDLAEAYPQEYLDWRDERACDETTLGWTAWLRAYHPEKVATDG